jgi:hypothetical protein
MHMHICAPISYIHILQDCIFDLHGCTQSLTYAHAKTHAHTRTHGSQGCAHVKLKAFNGVADVYKVALVCTRLALTVAFVMTISRFWGSECQH